MEITQQVKNFQATLQHTKPTKPSLKAEDKPVYSHEKALQALANGVSVDYQSTLRVVTVEGDRAPRLPPRVTQKPPGYIRNESGGLFTS